MKKFFHLFAVVVIIVSCKQSGPEPTAPLPAEPIQRLLDTTQMQQDLQQLSSDAFMGRNPNNTAVNLSYELIQKRLRQAGVDSFDISFEQNFSLSGLGRKNFLGLVKGSSLPSDYIVVSAHFDHLGKTAAGIFHGADDNASGVGAVLATLVLSQVKFNLNLDMIARSDNNKLWACGLSHYPNYKYLVDSLKDRTSTQLVSGYDKPSDPQDWTYLSDQGSFHRKGIAFLYLGVEDFPEYHKVTDTYEKINLQKYFENANIAANMVALVDKKL